MNLSEYPVFALAMDSISSVVRAVSTISGSSTTSGSATGVVLTTSGSATGAVLTTSGSATGIVLTNFSGSLELLTSSTLAVGNSVITEPAGVTGATGLTGVTGVTGLTGAEASGVTGVALVWVGATNGIEAGDGVCVAASLALPGV